MADLQLSQPLLFAMAAAFGRPGETRLAERLHQTMTTAWGQRLMGGIESDEEAMEEDTDSPLDSGADSEEDASEDDSSLPSLEPVGFPFATDV